MKDSSIKKIKNRNEISYKSNGFNLLKSKIKYFNEINGTYRNFISIMIHILKNDFPFEVILKDGRKIIIQNKHDLLFLARDNAWKKCEISNERLSLRDNNGKNVFFDNWRQNGDIAEIFWKEIYKSEYIEDSIILDIGANIGDSSIYFSLNNAKKIIALEPSPKNFHAGLKNIEINKITNIEFLLAGCAGENKIMRIDPNTSNLGSFVESEEGLNVEMLTLDSITERYNIKDGVLKLDCEGYEHEIIIFSDESTLMNFKYIFGELHYKKIKPINEIKKKLEDIGFDVSFSEVDIKSNIPQYFKAKK